MENMSRKIIMIGATNKYLMKKATTEPLIEPKKRVVSETWTFPEQYFDHETQNRLVRNLSMQEEEKRETELKTEEEESFIGRPGVLQPDETKVLKTIVQQITCKIGGYKQQDIRKHKYDPLKFIDFKSVLQKLMECELKCRYCNECMFVLYDVVRERKQWSVDRIDNHRGHDVDNFHITCLDCNLKKRRRSDEHFLFTKQLRIVKKVI